MGFSSIMYHWSRCVGIVTGSIIFCSALFDKSQHSEPDGEVIEDVDNTACPVACFTELAHSAPLTLALSKTGLLTILHDITSIHRAIPSRQQNISVSLSFRVDVPVLAKQLILLIDNYAHIRSASTPQCTQGTFPSVELI